MSTESSREPVGSLAAEAARLVAALQGWATDHRSDPAAEGARLAQEHTEGGHDPVAVECRYCPLCRIARLARAATPEVRDHLADAALSLALAFKGFLDQTPGSRTEATPVEKIDLAED